MSNSLRGKRISETYAKLVQIIGGVLYDGTGTVLPISTSGFGFQGPQGAGGLQGTTGVRGVSGGTGPRGYQGWQGISGLQGNTGPQGAIGFQGPSILGETGSEGPQGWQGIEGPQGAIGFQGPSILGETGSEGPQGWQGPEGLTGSDTSLLLITGLTSSYILALSDKGNLVEITSGSTASVTVPNNNDVQFETGSQILLVRGGSGAVGIVGATGVSVNSTQGYLNLNFQYSAATLVKKSTNTWYLFGDLKA
jgi:hypothetical protein